MFPVSIKLSLGALVFLFVLFCGFILYRDGVLSTLYNLARFGLPGGLPALSLPSAEEFLKIDSLSTRRFLLEGVDERSLPQVIQTHAELSSKLAKPGPILIGPGCLAKPLVAEVDKNGDLLVENRDKETHLLAVAGERLSVAPSGKAGFKYEELGGPGVRSLYCDGVKAAEVLVR